jgi:hypothetical protein
MTSSRREVGGLAAVELRSALAHTEVGLRMERSLTDYRIEPDSQAAQGWRLAGRTPVAAVFARQVRAIGRRLQLDAGVSLAAASGHAHADPGARLRWRLSERVTLIGSYVRRHQYAQSLRNPESVVGNVFPAELWLGSGAPGVPTGRSDLAVVAAELRPSPGVRVGGQAYARRMAGLLLAAPGAAEPFTTASFTTGSGSALGASLDASVSTARYAVLASYGFQRVRLGDDGVRYIPEYGTTHLLEGGVILFPSATSSIRLGVTGAFGRRSTTTSGGLEWESCNLLDRGCELGGSPHYAGAPLGGTRLPAYVRIDLGLRKHWHIQLGGRDAVVALFGTVTNVLGRANLLTYARDPSTGVASAVELRSLSPLVVGLDWQF